MNKKLLIILVSVIAGVLIVMNLNKSKPSSDNQAQKTISSLEKENNQLIKENDKLSSQLTNVDVLETNESTTNSKEQTSESTTSDIIKDESETPKVDWLLMEFSRNWLNFSDVFERNQSVRSYLTDKCIEENSIDVDPNVKYESVGEISLISQGIENKSKFVVVGVETSTESKNDVVMEIELDETMTKIDKIDMSYVKKGY